MKSIYKLWVILITVANISVARAQLSGPVGFSLPGNKQPLDITALEYYFDTDPGMGLATVIPVSGSSDINVSQYSLPVETLSFGVHRLYVRAKNINRVWSQTNAATLFVLSAPVILPANSAISCLKAAECFFDQDPGIGDGTVIPITLGDGGEAHDFALQIDTLSSGPHRLYVRVENDKGVWSVTSIDNFYIVPDLTLIPANSDTASIVGAEYFLDLDPGAGNGTDISVGVGTNVTVTDLAVNITGLATGVHHIYVRTRNAKDTWSMTNISDFYIVPVSFSIPPNASKGKITALEYFFDSDPGFGNGHLLTVSPTSDLVNFQITADIGNLQQDTVHTLYIRTLDGWSQTTSAKLLIGEALPVKWLSFTGKMEPRNMALLKWQTAMNLNSAEFIVERSRDGISYKQLGKVAAGVSEAINTYTFSDPFVPSGTIYYRIEELDKDGHYSYSNVLPINNMIAAASSFYVINNPVHSQLRVHLGNHPAGGKLQVFDMNGRELLSLVTTNADVQQMDVSRLTAGIYIVRYTNRNSAESKKFLKD